MIIIPNNIIPFKGFEAINIAGIIFARHEAMPLSERTKRHERIHTRQIFEMLIVPFYLWYIIEYLIRLIQYRDRRMAYRNISFEREAFANDHRPDYLDNRRFWRFIHYINIRRK